jgi:hypothetical protein
LKGPEPLFSNFGKIFFTICFFPFSGLLMLFDSLSLLLLQPCISELLVCLSASQNNLAFEENSIKIDKSPRRVF